MCEITTNFRLQLCIDMVLNQPFWYLSKVKLVFLVMSCRKMWCSYRWVGMGKSVQIGLNYRSVNIVLRARSPRKLNRLS